LVMYGDSGRILEDSGTMTTYFGNFLFWKSEISGKQIYKEIYLKGIYILRYHSIFGLKKCMARNVKMYGKKIKIEIFLLF